MRSNIVVVLSPGGGPAPSFEDRRETVRVEQLIADLSVERFDLSILRWLARIGEVQVHGPLRAPSQHRAARELRAVVEAKGLGEASLQSDILKAADDIVASEREPDFQCQAFSHETVGHCNRFDNAAMRQPDRG